MKIRAEKVVPSFSITTMLGIQEFSSDENVFIFYKKYNKLYSKKEKTKVIERFVSELFQNENENKKILEKNIETLFEKLSKNKNDFNKKVETSAFQMYFLSYYFPKAIEIKNDGNFVANLKYIPKVKVFKIIEDIELYSFITKYVEKHSVKNFQATEYFFIKNFLGVMMKLNKENNFELQHKKEPCKFCLITSVSNEKYSKTKLSIY